jgi:hypothetical protein
MQHQHLVIGLDKHGVRVMTVGFIQGNRGHGVIRV